ncbi:MAG TPA: DUF4340 domain-containing protein [Gemmatimonadales bacterium]|nr:DUF4340 domain-containing protein [Gemmatimonadales bacterium]
MTPKQLLRLAVALAVLLALWGAVAVGRRLGEGEEERLALPAVDTAAVDSIVLTRAAETTRLAKSGPGRWTVNGHPAAAGAVGDLLVALRDTAAGGELVAQSPGSHGRLGVDSGGTRLRLVGGGRTVLDLVTGHRTRDFDGVYARRADDDAVYALRGAFPTLLERRVDDWREKRIAAVQPESVTAVEIARGRASYRVRKQDASWAFDRGGPADSAAVASLLGQLRDVSASGFATATQADSARFTPADRRLWVLGAGERPLLTLLFDSTAGGFWVRHDSGGTIYRMDSWQADRYTPADSTLRPRPGDS